MTFNAYLDQAQWEAMPMRPMELKKAGREVFFVSRQSGMLRALPGLKEIKEFQSFRRHEVGGGGENWVVTGGTEGGGGGRRRGGQNTDE